MCSDEHEEMNSKSSLFFHLPLHIHAGIAANIKCTCVECRLFISWYRLWICSVFIERCVYGWARRTVTIAEQLCCATVLVRRCVNVYLCFLTADHFPSHMHTSQINCDSIALSRSVASCVFLHYTHLFIHFIHSFRVHFVAFCENCFCSHTKCQYSMCPDDFFSISSSTKS